MDGDPQWAENTAVEPAHRQHTLGSPENETPRSRWQDIRDNTGTGCWVTWAWENRRDLYDPRREPLPLQANRAGQRGPKRLPVAI